IPPLPASRSGGTALDHGAAEENPRARSAASGALLRFHEDGRDRLAGDERRGRDPQPHRHRTSADVRRPRHGRDLDRHPLLAECEAGDLNAQVTGRLTEGLSGIRIVKAYRAEKHEERVFTTGAHRLLRLVIATMNTVSTVGGLTTMLAGIVGVIILLVGAREVVAAHMTLGDLVSFIVYLGLVIGPIAQIVAIGTQLSEAF